MAITYVEIEDRYFVQPSDTDPVTVNVIIGDGQSGGYLIFLNQELISANSQADLGAASSAIGKRCLVSAAIVDILDQTNWTSVTVEVRNGDNSKIYGPYSREAAAHLDTICYSISIQFKTP